MSPNPEHEASTRSTFAGRHRNIELKARVADLTECRRVAQQISAKRVGLLRQTDTYFSCENGRLKLRENDDDLAQLIWYQRPDTAGPKGSDYCLVKVNNAATLKSGLTKTLGVRAVVEKRRELFLYQNVRIHLDDVDQLGEFLEFEAVLSNSADEATGKEQVDFLCEQFGLSASDFVSTSYVDLIGLRENPET